MSLYFSCQHDQLFHQPYSIAHFIIVIITIHYFLLYIEQALSSNSCLCVLLLKTLFLELRKIERLAASNIFDKEWLSEILRELVETIFVWISTNKDMWTTSDENSTPENSIICKQVNDIFIEKI